MKKKEKKIFSIGFNNYNSCGIISFKDNLFKLT